MIAIFSKKLFDSEGLLKILMAATVMLAWPINTAAAQESGLQSGLGDSPLLGSDLRVELRAPTMVMLSSPMAGRLAEVKVKDGDYVSKDDLLVQVDDSLPLLRYEMSKASRDQADTQLRLAAKLHKLGSRGALDVKLAQAQFEAADAEMMMSRQMVDFCRIKAPFAGRVTHLEVKENQHVGEGSPLLELAEYGAMEIEFMMPSSWLSNVKTGSKFEVRIDETGKRYPAEIIRLGGKVDPLTQSIRAYGRLNTDDDTLLPGMTGMVLHGDEDEDFILPG